MPQTPAGTFASIRSLAQQLALSGRVEHTLFGDRDVWQIRLRWWVPPAICVGVLASAPLGFAVATRPILLVAAFVLLYNLVFHLGWRHSQAAARPLERQDRRNEILQVALDYGSMFLLILYTGGPASPFLFFFIFHVIFAAILFRPSTAYWFAGAATAGMWVLFLLMHLDILRGSGIVYRNQAFGFPGAAGPATVWLGFFSVTMVGTAAATTLIMRRLNQRVRLLAQAHERVAGLNERLNSLYNMIKAVGAQSRLEPVLSVLAPELAAVIDAPVVTVKALSGDGRVLHYLASHGLPPGFTDNRVVEVAQSPLTRRVIEEADLVHGRLSEHDSLVHHRDLVELGLRSVMLAPLTVEGRVIGVLGAYSRSEAKFDHPDTEFLRLTAELVAIAIDDARAFESLDTLMQERSQFMLQVAHNMRAPLTAAMSMLEVIRGGYLGPVENQQTEYLDRVHLRLGTMNTAIGELLTLARNRQGGRPLERVMVDMNLLAGRVEHMFRERARIKGLHFEVRVAEILPQVEGDLDMLEQMIENTVSNAIKYTPEGGSVDVSLTRDGDGRVVIAVRDTGIGIPESEKPRLFSEFFRASNAKKVEDIGTGLGLALIKQTVERHGGSVSVDSTEGKGTTVTLALPTSGP